ncbi:MAG: HAD family hydrolase [Bacillota bacterium]|nr:HAD family hydrolase [Bacillota bacterium]
MKAVFFDLDDTLHDHQKPFADAFNKVFHIKLPIETLYKKFRDYSDFLWDSYVKNNLSLVELRQQRIMLALKDYEMEITEKQARDFQDYYEYCLNHLELFPNTVELLENIKKLGMGVGILSNGPTEHQLNKISSLGLTKIIERDLIFISDSVGVAKPNPEIFIHVANKVHITPNELLYVGDSWINDVVAPSQAGWSAVWFNHRGRKPGTKHTPLAEINELSKIVEVLRG